MLSQANAAYLQHGKCTHYTNHGLGKEEQLAVSWTDSRLRLAAQVLHQTGTKIGVNSFKHKCSGKITKNTTAMMES